MANRSYLYSTNTVPGSDAWENKRVLRGLAEWNYDIPIVYKVLLSGNPRACRSSIFDTPELLAIVGDYEAGVNRLKAFLARVNEPGAYEIKEAAIEFLSLEQNRREFFVLECTEIFDLTEGSLEDKNSSLVSELTNLEPKIRDALLSLPPPARLQAKGGLIAKLFGRGPTKDEKPDVLQPVFDLGLGSWSNVLCYDFDEPSDQPA